MAELPLMPNNEDKMNELIVVEKIAQWQKLKTLVLDSVSSPITKRVYNMALDEFYAWFQQGPRSGFTKATEWVKSQILDPEPARFAFGLLPPA